MNRKFFIILVIIAPVFAILSDSCSTSRDAGMVTEKAGTELWSENCSRCHNAPPPSAFESEEWEVVGLHMRMRANLTAEETRKIVEFLQSEE